jgi:hypothetical protein
VGPIEGANRVSPEHAPEVLVMREDGCVMSQRPTHGAEASTSHATPLAPDITVAHLECCGDSRGYRTPTMREDESSRTKTKTQDKGQSKALFSIVDFSKVDPLYKCRSVSFYREAGGLFTF